MAKKRWVCVCFVCVWKLSAGPSSVAILPWNTYFILAEEEAERILRHESPHTAGHTHTHASHWEGGAHTHRGTRKDAELVLFFLSRRPWMLRRQRDRRSRTSAPMEIPSRTDGTPTWPRTHPTGAVRARASPSLLQGNSNGHRQGASLPVRQGKCTRRAYLW